jgi:iron complex outermembrane receptor protein
MKVTCYWGLAAAGLQIAAPANAQTTQSDAKAQDASGNILEDIVVTAERRESRLIDVPASLSAFGEQELQSANISSARDLTRITPGLFFSQSSYVSQPTVRGIGSRGSSPGDESNVAVYIDGVYQPDAYAINIDFANVERVEVLKGPQGTLFGRNATGGAINIITAQPSFQPQIKASATYGRFDYREVSARVTGPVTQTIAASIAGNAYREDAYIDDIARGGKIGGRKNVSLRGAILFEPADGLSFMLRGTFSNRRNGTDAATSAYLGNARARTNVPGTPIAGPFESAITEGYFHVLQNEGDFRANYDAGPVTFTYLGSYIFNRLNIALDNDFSAPRFAQTNGRFQTNATIHDLQVTSNGDGRFKWIIGGNYFYSKSGVPRISQFATTFDALNGIANTGSAITGTSTTAYETWQRASAMAVYAEGTLEPVDHLFLTGGVRYTDENRSYTVQRYSPTPGSASSRRSWNNASPHASIRYEFSPNANIYASYSEGFKSGIYNTLSSTTPAPAPADPETATAYEVGAKVILSPSLRVSAAAFSYDYSNLQIQASTSGTQIALINAANAKIQGGEFDIQWRPVNALTFRVGASFLPKSKFTSFPGASVQIPNTTTTPANGNVSAIRDVTGNRLIRSPKRTANLGAQWTTPLAGGEFQVGADLYLSTGYYWEVLNVIRQPGYALLTANATWRSADDCYRITLAGDNVTDATVASSVLPSNNGSAAQYVRPRFISLTFAYSLR